MMNDEWMMMMDDDGWERSLVVLTKGVRASDVLIFDHQVLAGNHGA